MNPDRLAQRRWRSIRDRRRRICQCVWHSGHLCAINRPCEAHARAEYEYADAQVSGKPMQLKLF